MQRLADDLFLLPGFPPHAINVYLMGGVLVDSGTRLAHRRIKRALRKHRVTAHALTHVHPDHQGSSRVLCEALDVPLWCGAGDADAAEDPALMFARLPDHWLTRTIGKRWAGPGQPVERSLREGDRVGGFTVLEAPGHSAGHIAFWREGDRTLVVGDVLINMHLATGLPRLGEPLRIFTPDPALNRHSARRLAALEPRLVCFGHGPPLRDEARLARFVAGLANMENTT